MNQPRSAALETLFRQFAPPEVPGACVLVVHQGELCFARGFGCADLENQIPCELNTNFRLASVTKQFTAMAVLMLIEKQNLAFDERLTDLFPEFPTYGKEITVSQLLSHTSGLLDYEELIPAGTQIPLRDHDVLRLLMEHQNTYFVPGSRYRYSNSAYALLALAVELRSGQRFAQFLQQHIFQPLGMHHTLAYEPGFSKVPHRAYGYSRDGAGFKRTDQNLTSSVLGDGGIYSSVTDLYRWDQALYSEALVSRSLVQRAFTPIVQTDLPRTAYGFGWYISRYRGSKEIWHSGETIGFRTWVARFPERQFTIIILANRSEANLETLAHRIAEFYRSVWT